MNEEDDMLELLDEEDLTADSDESDELELNDEPADDQGDDSLDLDDTEEDLGLEEEAGEEVIAEVPERGEEPEKEGLEIDIRYIIVAVVAIAAILIGAVFFVMPMFADKAPVASFNPSQTGEDLFLYHAGGDALAQEYLGVLINGAPLPADKYTLMGGATWPWSSGAVLRLDTTGYTKPATVVLTYMPKSTTYTVYSTSVAPTPTPTPTPEPIITPSQEQVAGNATPGNLTTPGNVTGSAGQTAPVIEEVIVVVPTVMPGASTSVVMDVQPASGSAPLTIQCNDLTGGCVRNRVWNFGDDQTSMKRNPAHVYPFPGTYNITLDVRFCDPDDNPAELPTKSVVVEPSVRHDTLAQGTGVAKVLAGGTFYFTVKGPGTNIRIGGRDHYLEKGDHASISLGSDGNGDISVVSGAILRCNFSNATLTVNGEDIETGTISVINIDQYLQFETANLTIKVLAGRDGAKGMVDGQPVIQASPGQQILLQNVGIDSTGKLLFSVQDSAGFTFRGGTGSYEVTTPPPL